jgi:hypothetical protein
MANSPATIAATAVTAIIIRTSPNNRKPANRIRLPADVARMHVAVEFCAYARSNQQMCLQRHRQGPMFGPYFSL